MAFGHTKDPQVDAIAHTAGVAGINLAPVLTKGMDTINPNKPFNVEQQVSTINSAVKDTSQKLEQASDIRRALIQQTNGSAPGSPGSHDYIAALGNQLGLGIKVAGVIGGAAAAAMASGPAAAAIGVGGLVTGLTNFVTSAPSGTQHAGLKSAGLINYATDAAPTTFKPLGSEGKKGKDSSMYETSTYRDVMGGEWTPQGMPAIPAQPVPLPSPRIREAASVTVATLGSERVKDDLQKVTTTEKALIAQGETANRQAQLVFGQEKPGLDYDIGKPVAPAGPSPFGMKM